MCSGAAKMAVSAKVELGLSPKVWNAPTQGEQSSLIASLMRNGRALDALRSPFSASLRTFRSCMQVSSTPGGSGFRGERDYFQMALFPTHCPLSD